MPRRVGLPDIGDPALEGCLLTEAQLDAALAEQGRSGKPLPEKLVAITACDRSMLWRPCAESFLVCQSAF